jgi:hypothetical protein
MKMARAKKVTQAFYLILRGTKNDQIGGFWEYATMAELEKKVLALVAEDTDLTRDSFLIVHGVPMAVNINRLPTVNIGATAGSLATGRGISNVDAAVTRKPAKRRGVTRNNTSHATA